MSLRVMDDCTVLHHAPSAAIDDASSSSLWSRTSHLAWSLSIMAQQCICISKPLSSLWLNSQWVIIADRISSWPTVFQCASSSSWTTLKGMPRRITSNWFESWYHQNFICSGQREYNNTQKWPNIKIPYTNPLSKSLTPIPLRGLLCILYTYNHKVRPRKEELWEAMVNESAFYSMRKN